MTRAAYHHGELREALLEAGLLLVQAKGEAGFSLREAARMAGVSTAAPYKHFEDRQAFLVAVARQARQALLEAQHVALEGQPPTLAFRALGLATVRFAVENPNWFLLLSDARYVDGEDPEHASLEDLFADAMQAALDATSSAAAPAVVEVAAHALTYGLVRLVLDGHLGEVSGEEAEILAEQVFNVVGAGFFAQDPPPKP